MLDNEKYQLALEAIKTFSENHKQFEKILHELLEQHFQTGRALKKLNATISSPPSELPHINELHKAVFDPTKPILISVVGIPNAFKTTSIIGVAGVSDARIITVPERYKEIKQRLLASNKFSFENVADILTQIQSTDLNDAILQASISRYPITTIFDRDYADIAMTRALFISGLLDLSHFIDHEKRYAEYKSTRRFYSNSTIVISLIPPQIALSRQSENEKMNRGQIMTVRFLQTLYEQYLRFYQELLESKADEVEGISFMTVDSTDTDNPALINALRTLFPNTEPMFNQELLPSFR